MVTFARRERAPYHPLKDEDRGRSGLCDERSAYAFERAPRRRRRLRLVLVVLLAILLAAVLLR